MSNPDPNRSCLNCPSLLSPDESVQFFNKSVGAPVCARFGRVIGSATTDEPQRQKIAKQIARNCGEHGNPRPSNPDWSRATFTVALPDPEVLSGPRNQQDLVKTCASCVNYVRPDVVSREFGWSAALCAAKGRLLLGNRLTFEARDCEYRSFGGVRTDIGNIVMLPEYEEDWKPTGDPVKNYFHTKKHNMFIDPVDYVTDKPVSEEDASHGIRAWREITDPESGNKVYLPIYNLDFFTEDERAKIPRTGDDEHPEDYVDHNFYTYKVAVLWAELDETPGLWGEPGTGKTEFFRYMAWLMCLPFERISITASTELEDLAGKMHFSKDKGTFFEYGRVPKAWMKPCILCIDEPNVGPPDVWQYLRPMTDNSKQLVMDMNGGERLDRHDDCYLGLAMNPAWDAKNVGANMIGDADVNRLMHLFIELPPPELEREIIKNRCAHDNWEIPKERVDTLMKIASDIRPMCKDGALPVSWGIRPQLKVARASRWFDLVTAYRMASADFLEPEAQQALLDIVRSHLA